MGSKGLFVAMIMAILSTEVYRVIIQKDITIKMPSSVPPAVAKSFTALIPAAVIILISFVIRLAFEASPFESIHYVVAKLLVKPLTAISGSYLGIVVQTVLISLLWSAGIHGSSIVTGVMAPVFATMLDQNRMAFEAGQEIPNILTEQFMALYPKLGGSGCTLALALFMLFKARSKQLKEIGKLSVGPALFNINEPVIFGMPIVMNPILIIPFILAPVAAVSVAYWGMKLGLASKLVGIAVPWTSPIGLGPYIASGGAISAVILQLASFLTAGAIYYPFFKMWDAMKVAEEKLEETEEANELEIA
jgi:PTS system cellobiose-specific IIC component